MARAVFIDVLDTLAGVNYLNAYELRHADVPDVLLRLKNTGRPLILFLRVPTKQPAESAAWKAQVETALAKSKLNLQAAGIARYSYDALVPVPFAQGESSDTISKIVQSAYAEVLAHLHVSAPNAIAITDAVIGGPAAARLGMANVTLPSVNHLRLLARHNLARQSPLALIEPLLDSLADGKHEEIKIEKMPLTNPPAPAAPAALGS